MGLKRENWTIQEEESEEEGFSVYRNNRVVQYGCTDLVAALRVVKRKMGAGFSVTVIDKNDRSRSVST